MFRRLSLAFAIAAALSPMAAYPLGLGEIHPKSYLNQAFSADIDLLSVDPEELDTVKVDLAPPVVFERAGIPRPFFLSKLDFTPQATPDGKAIIRVSSDERIREPFVSFMIEVNWPKGRAVREYTVLLDPPVVTQRRPKPVAAPSVASRPASTSAAPASAASGAAATGALEYGPTKPNDTLWSIAGGMRVEGATVEQVLMALYRYNPNAFIGNNVNRLKVGQVLRLPGADSALEQTRSEARAELQEQSEIWRAESEAATAPAAIEEADAEAVEEEPTPISLQGPEAGADASVAVPESPAPGEPELKLVEGDLEASAVAPDGVPGEAESGAEAGPEAASQDRGLLLAREEAAVARQEATEMRGRIGELEEQLGEMQRLMTVQNDRLAQLQDQAEEASKPQELVVPPPAPQSFFERLMSGDKVVLGLLGAVGVLLMGLLALLVRGRKREAAAFAAPAMAPPQPAPRAAERASAGEFSNQTAALAASAAAVTGAAATAGATLASAPAPAEEPALDPLAEVDVYVAYGRYEQAEEMLMDEIRRDPERLDYQHKLLEVYAEAGDHESFVAQADKMSQAGAEDRDPKAWSRVMEMGRTLAPGAALFGGTAATAGDSTPEPEAQDNFDLDLDLDLAGAGEPEAAPVSGASETTVAENLDFELDDFDFGAEEQAESEPASAVEAPQPEVLEDDDEGLSLDEVGGLMKVPAPPPEEPEEPEELVLDTDAFTGVDQEEVETKIDLALAYQDMGDPDDARIILEEVLREGNDDQQQRARELLQALS